jgi:hypothetical protein
MKAQLVASMPTGNWIYGRDAAAEAGLVMNIVGGNQAKKERSV